MGATVHLSGKLKRALNGIGHRVSGTVVAVNSVGAIFNYYDPNTSVSARVATVAWTMPADTLVATGYTDREGSLTIFTAGDSVINAMLSVSASIAIPDGIYLINNPLEVTANHALAPASAGGLVILKAAAAFTGRIIDNSFADNFTVTNLVFDGNYSARAALEGLDTAALIYTQSNKFTARSCTFRNSPSDAIWEYNCSAAVIEGCTFSMVWRALRVDGNDKPGPTFSGNAITNTAAFPSIQGMECINTVDFVVRDSSCQGIGLLSSTSHGFEGTWGNAFYIWKAVRPVVTSCTAANNYWSSVVIGQSATSAIVRNSTLGRGFFSIGSTSIWVEQPGCDHIIIADNICDGSIEIGDGGGNHAVVRNNQIASDRLFGINLNSACLIADISGNTITSNVPGTMNGIYLWEKNTSVSSSVSIVNNTFVRWGKAVRAENSGLGGTIYNIDISGSTFTSCSTTATCANTMSIDPSCSGIQKL